MAHFVVGHLGCLHTFALGQDDGSNSSLRMSHNAVAPIPAQAVGRSSRATNRPFARYIAKRSVGALVVLAVIAVGIFTLVRVAPGDPVELMLDPQARVQAGPEYVERVRASLGLDQSIPVQFFAWLKEVLSGNLGFSYASRLPVTSIMASRLGPTALLMGTALIVGTIVAVPIGIIAAMRRNSIVDYVMSVVSMIALSTPSFFMGIIGIYIFAVTLGWLPSAGMATTGVPSSLADRGAHLVLPAGILALVIAAQLTRYIRSGLVDALREDYVRTARSKGASEARVVFLHAFRNALGPLITVFAIMLPRVFAGAVVVETIFAWPGMGQLVVSAVAANDYPVVVAFALYVAVLVLLFNFLADVMYAFVDPRIRYEE